MAVVDPPPRLVFGEREHDTLSRLIRLLLRLVRREPVVMGTLLAAVVAEGRRYADTAEGSRLAAALADTELVKRGGLLWQSLGLDALTCAVPKPADLPSKRLRQWALLVESCDLEALLASLDAE